MIRWSGLSVGTKLSLVTMTACAVALAMTTASVVLNEVVSARAQLTAELQSVTDVVGNSSTAAVQFGDARAAGDALSALRGYGSVEGARIEVPDSGTLARYGREVRQVTTDADGFAVISDRGHVLVSRPIMLDGHRIGTIVVEGRLDGLTARLQRYAIILLVVVAVSALVAYGLSSRLQRSISGPIVRLARAAEAVAAGGDYGIRAVKEHDDELGGLVEQFNAMLATIQGQNAELLQGRTRLEQRVAERTRTLSQEIEQHRRTEQALSVAKAAAESANVAKSAFLANMSHEPRTPLNAIIGYSEMLKEDAEAVAATDTVADLERILSAGRHLLALINDVLDLSKIESGKMTLHPERFDVGTLVHDLISTVQPLAEKNGNMVRCEIPRVLAGMYSDATKVRQVMLNVLSNACKFTHDGTITVQIDTEVRDNGGWTLFTVRDTGIGMSAEQMSRLFQDFAQADTSTTRKYGGTGLGLAISRRYCRMLGGDVRVTSELGRGATFVVELPVDLPAKVLPICEPADAPAAASTPDRASAPVEPRAGQAA